MATGAAILGASLIGLVGQGASSMISYRQQKQAQKKQEEAMAAAEAKQTAANNEAELARLEAVAANTSGKSERVGRFDFGKDNMATSNVPSMPSVNATSSLTEDEEFNPFYTRGLV